MNLPLRIIALAIMLGGACASLSAQWSAGFTGYAQSLSLSGDYPDAQGIHPAIGYGAGVSLAYRLIADLELSLEPSFDLRHGDVRETIRATAASDPYDTTLATIRGCSQAAFSLACGQPEAVLQDPARRHHCRRHSRRLRLACSSVLAISSARAEFG